jgi:site-specific DNA recombinase
MEQDFNSLDAQREACEAYVKSQAHEGWIALHDRFGDGGFSGGSMDRPALQQLTEIVRNRRIDTIVVYKVDRLTRSLADFAKLVELFDEHTVSFVSVTQSFNTTSSMGRLTLNVLLSFAQFEREVTGERIRDKIAASKKKGIWVGGVVPLGYRVEDKKLLVDPPEAETVRMIFERYLALGSLPALQGELREQGVLTRRRALATGETIGGVALTNGPLAYLLRNRVYLGDINHKGLSYAGAHEAIVDPTLFEAVHTKLTENLRGHRQRRSKSNALLLGRIFDDRGNRMTPTYAIKSGARYRYYASSVLAQGRKAEAGSLARIAAREVDALVLKSIRQLSGPNPEMDKPESDFLLIEKLVERVVISRSNVAITFVDRAPVTIAWSPPTFPRKREVIAPSGHTGDIRPIRAEARTKLVKAIAKSRLWLDELMSGTARDTDQLALRENVTERSIRTLLTLAFLAPDLVKAAVDGRLPRGFGVSRLVNLPSKWEEQRRTLGLESKPVDLPLPGPL